MADKLTQLASELGVALKQKGWMLTLAESCTGGMAAQYVTAIPGSSIWFERGFVTYSNPAKAELLGVSVTTLQLHGAVSEQTACEMAQGALKHSHAQIAAAITGIAGPDGGTDEKPVGTVWFAWSIGNKTHSELQCFSGNRDQIRKKSAAYALQGLLELTLSTDL